MDDDRDTNEGDQSGDAGAVDGDDVEEPVAEAHDAVGDGRQKYVEVVTADGEQHEHGGSYLRQSEDVFIVSDEPGFPPSDTVTYDKTGVSRVRVEQHHSACFITTAVAGDERTLADLREFRDDALAPSPVGRPLVGLYERTSPPIAATIAAHPDGMTAAVVRPLVRRCAGIARRRETAAPPTRTALSMLLVALYVVGIAVAAVGHVATEIRHGDSTE